MTLTEFKRKIGAKKYAEIATYAEQLAAQGKSPDTVIAAVKRKFKDTVIPKPVFVNIIAPCFRE